LQIQLSILSQANRDSGYPTPLKIEEGVQLNAEIVCCNCKIPLWMEKGLQVFSGKLVRLMSGK
jgi:hypothetical protein